MKKALKIFFLFLAFIFICSVPITTQSPEISHPLYIEPTSTTQEETIIITTKPLTPDYILNTNTMKFHYPDCHNTNAIKPDNRIDYNGSRNSIIGQGYIPCKNCNP